MLRTESGAAQEGVGATLWAGSGDALGGVGGRSGGAGTLWKGHCGELSRPSRDRVEREGPLAPPTTRYYGEHRSRGAERSGGFRGAPPGANSVRGFVPVEAGAYGDVERDAQGGGAFHGRTDQVMGLVVLAGGDLDEQLVVHLEQHPGAQARTGQ